VQGDLSDEIEEWLVDKRGIPEDNIEQVGFLIPYMWRGGWCVWRTEIGFSMGSFKWTCTNVCGYHRSRIRRRRRRVRLHSSTPHKRCARCMGGARAMLCTGF